MSKILNTELISQIAKLEAGIASANSAQFLDLQPKLHGLLTDLAKQGYLIPARLRDLDHNLEDDAVEAQFDNLPL